ncbi:MAG: hypothetical protein H6586_04455 [Flavobacteriales bacterium]|nr:hypothetical protein [Flavobacteriales bacterium]
MKELHHHIFSNTACISKETMLKYINKQLTDKELHDVQKHLLDCEFCSEALEGMKYAQDSSMLFTIDHQIDQIAARKRTPIIKTLMIAASILVIIFGSYFTYTAFDNALQKSESSISLNTASEETKEEDMELPPPAPEVTEKLKAAEGEASGMANNLQQEAPVFDEVPAMMDIVEEDAEAEEEISMDGYLERQKNEEVAANTISANDDFTDLSSGYRNNDANITTEKGDVLMDAESKKNKDVVSQTLAKEQTIESANTSTFGNTAYNRNIASGEVVTKSASISGKKDKNKTKKEAAKPRAATNQPVLDNVVESDDANVGGLTDSNIQPTEAEKNLEYFSLAENEAREESVADFKAEVDKTKEIVPSLNNAIQLYENKQYSKALSELEAISQNTQEDENKIRWYKALCLIELKHPEMAKPLLNTIIKNNKTFVKEAKEKLAELE